MTDNLLIAEASPETPAEDIVGKPENIPTKFWDAEKQEIRVDALLNSYLSLEKRLSKMVPIPENDDEKNAFKNYWAAQTVPMIIKFN